MRIDSDESFPHFENISIPETVGSRPPLAWFAALTMLAYIDDGYTERGFLTAIPGLHPAVAFSYRPMLLTELARFAERTAHASQDAVRREAARWLSLKLVEWDLCDSQNRTVPIFATTFPLDNLLRVKPCVFVRMWKIVCGDAPSDPPFDKHIDLEADGKNFWPGRACGERTPRSPDATATTACDTSTTIPAGSD